MADATGDSYHQQCEASCVPNCFSDMNPYFPYGSIAKAIKTKYISHLKNHCLVTNSGSGEEEPEWMEVVTEVLLSLLSHNSHLLRTVVKNVFSMLYPHLTSAALQIIVEVCIAMFPLVYINVREFYKQSGNFGIKTPITC